GYGIHGTSAPMCIYQFRSHGCIRLHPEDIEKLFSYLKRGFQGELAYKTVLLGQDDQGKLFLEVNPDIYRKNINALEQARRLADSYGVKERIDWSRVATVIESREGIAREVSL
ncbi:MAG: ErfK/YbiS/YcfS/YnhG family protein, partial [Halothiobacillaceae bacterium]